MDFKQALIDDAKLINVSFKLLQDNYLIKRSDETYHLYNKKGNELASKVSTTTDKKVFQRNFPVFKAHGFI